MSEAQSRTRYGFLDAYRGLCVLVMVVYHGAFDLAVYGYIPLSLLINSVMNVIHPIFAGSFVLMSGATCRFSRNNLKNAVVLGLTAAGVSLGTRLFTPDMFISFGILHFFASATLIYSLLGRLFERAEKILAPVFAAVFAVLYTVFPVNIQTSGLAFLGFSIAKYYSGDYYPIIPWIFLFFVGTYTGGLIKNGRMPKALYSLSCPPLEKIGRHSLLIYIVHQPVLYGAVTLLSKIK